MSMDVEAALAAHLDGKRFAFNDSGIVIDCHNQKTDEKRGRRDIINVATPPRRSSGPVRFSEITAAVEYVTGIGKMDLISMRRANRIVRARHIVMWAARKHTSMSLPAIGMRLGGKDHSTIIHGINKVEGRMADYADDIRRVEQLICR